MLFRSRETERDCFDLWIDQPLREFRILSGEQQLPEAVAAFQKGFAAASDPLSQDEQAQLLDYYGKEFVPNLPPNRQRSSP